MTIVVYIGWDPREQAAYDVCAHSIAAHASQPVLIRPIKLDALRQAGLYTRATEIREGRLWDTISEAPMATEFAISRFFAPLLAEREKLDANRIVFCDCDFLWLGDIAELLAEADDGKALCCVQHRYDPAETSKMDGQIQLRYARKNWSSLMLINRRHPANAALTLELLNGVPGRDLHRFCWLADDEIGSLLEDWNWLEGSSAVRDDPPRAIHFTRGGPWMAGWEHVDYAHLWRAAERSSREAGKVTGARSL